MTLLIQPTVPGLLNQLAEYFVFTAQQCIRENGRFTVALSGGSSPEKFYALLASDAYRLQVDWSKVFFFLGDERYVPVTDDDSNFKMINRVLFHPLHINIAQVFPVNTLVEAAEAAAQYMQQINLHFNHQPPRFDLVLLGLGDNSHTASLFPFTDILTAAEATVQSVYLPELQVFRISFTAPLINLAHRVAFLVYGENKAQAVHNVLEGPANIPLFPARLIRPVDGELSWYLDTAAASGLQNTSDKH